MKIERYDKNGIQLRIGDYLLRKDGVIFKVVFNPTLLAYGIVDKYSQFYFLDNWNKKDWEVKTYEELYKQGVIYDFKSQK